MTITSRGAVAPTSDRAGAGAGCADGGAGPDTAALDAVVHEVAARATRGPGLMRRPGRISCSRSSPTPWPPQDEWLAAACAAKGLAPGTHRGG